MMAWWMGQQVQRASCEGALDGQWPLECGQGGNYYRSNF